MQATRGSRTLNERVQAIKTEYSKKGMVRSMPGADPSRFTLNPLIDAFFVRMSNALTQIEHIQDPRDVVTAASEMDEYHFYLRSLHNNATRYAGYEPKLDSIRNPRIVLQVSTMLYRTHCVHSNLKSRRNVSSTGALNNIRQGFWTRISSKSMSKAGNLLRNLGML
jgi:hypothetical protein